MKSEQYHLNNVPVPEDFEEKVLTRTLLAQLPTVNAPQGFEDTVMNTLFSQDKSDYNSTRLSTRIRQLIQKNKTMSVVVLVSILVCTVWYSTLKNTTSDQNPNIPVNQKEIAPTQLENTLENQPQILRQKQTTALPKHKSNQRFKQSESIIKNDTSPIPGFKTESKGEHEED